MLYVNTCKIDNLLKDISDFIIRLTSIPRVTMTVRNKDYFVSVQRLYLTRGKIEYCVEYNLLQQFVRIICIVADDINLVLLFNSQYFYIVDNDM
jgi:hypothetical protein